MRDAVLMSSEDADRLELEQGEAVVLRNSFGAFTGRVFLAPVKAGTLEVHWPEGNVLVDPKARSPLARIPAYKEISATLERITETPSKSPEIPVLRP